ncbi:MAG TPA: hypothetical protein DIC52_01985 [Candidatus Latescibacteria bacterium]|nr:hypothetical protein [Candidatus Latescibacterota bacterium]
MTANQRNHCCNHLRCLVNSSSAPPRKQFCHVMTEFQPIEAQRVLQRYNVALAQAMLYRCRQLQVTVGRTSVRIR